VGADLPWGCLALLSLLLTLWQWGVGRRFPLHQRAPALNPAPSVTVFKPLKGCDAETRACLASWLAQTYSGEMQLLFGVADEGDPVVPIARELLAAAPHRDAQLVICPERPGANGKVATLLQLTARARHEVWVVSDADVRAPMDLLAQLVSWLDEPRVGLVHCFYRLANPATRAMDWTAVAVNADFWSQVLQAQSLRAVDFALGATLGFRRRTLDAVGGFEALVPYLADDFQLGQLVARAGWEIRLCPVVVDCWEPLRDWRGLWRQQLRWARTIRACRPLGYFFSLLSNATLWPVLWLVAAAIPAIRVPMAPLLDTGLVAALPIVTACLLVRLLTAWDLQRRLQPSWPRRIVWWMPLLKDLFQVALWISAFTGGTVHWRGARLRVGPRGRLRPVT
jgi:ceramide glucosyltransferase